MAGEWIKLELGEVCEVKQGRYLGPGDMAPHQTTSSAIPVIGANGTLGYTNVPSYREPVTLVTCRGSNCGLLQRTKGPAWISNNAIACPPRAGFDSRFIHYVLSAVDFSDVVTGSAQPQITTGHLTKKNIWVTRDLPEQRAIAHILGTLDDKIELNRRMNETLEAMARALFKSWFVDFDPVRAKISGSAEHQLGATPTPSWGSALPGDLFPDKLVESELGEIPEGWRVGSLDQLANFLNGLAMQKFPPKPGGGVLPVIKIAQLRAGSTVGADLAAADIKQDYIVQDGDILFSWSGSLECVLWTGGIGALNQHLFKVIPSRYPRWLCYLAIHHHLDHFRHIAAGKATTMGHIQRHHLSDAKVPIPPANPLEAMNQLMTPLFQSIWTRAVESRTLAQLRDTLLPKLISGELRVADAERVVEEVV